MQPMNKHIAEATLYATRAYRFRRKHWAVNAVCVLVVPATAAVVLPASFVLSVLHGVAIATWEAIIEAVEIHAPMLQALKPRWQKRSEYFEKEIVAAREYLAERGIAP